MWSEQSGWVWSNCCESLPQSEDTVKRAAQHKRTCYNRNNTLKSKYDSHCKAADNAEETHNRLHSNPQTKPKDLTQAARKMDTTRLAANTADTQYQESIRSLEDARQLWEREMEVLCKVGEGVKSECVTVLWDMCVDISQLMFTSHHAIYGRAIDF